MLQQQQTILQQILESQKIVEDHQNSVEEKLACLQAIESSKSTSSIYHLIQAVM